MIQDDLRISAAPLISEHLDDLTDAAKAFDLSVPELIKMWDEEELNLGSKLHPSQQARAMYHIGYILGFAVSREKTVEELFEELGLP